MRAVIPFVGKRLKNRIRKWIITGAWYHAQLISPLLPWHLSPGWPLSPLLQMPLLLPSLPITPMPLQVDLAPDNAFGSEIAAPDGSFSVVLARVRLMYWDVPVLIPSAAFMCLAFFCSVCFEVFVVVVAIFLIAPCLQFLWKPTKRCHDTMRLCQACSPHSTLRKLATCWLIVKSASWEWSLWKRLSLVSNGS